MELMAFLEDRSTALSYADRASAALGTDYSKRYPFPK